MNWVKKSITRIIGLTILLVICLLFIIYFNLLNAQFKDYFEQQSNEKLVKDSESICTEIEMYLQKYTIIVDQAGLESTQ